QRNQDAARPRRDLIQIEVEPVWKENNLGRYRWHCIVVVLSERTEINLGKGVAFNDATIGQNPLARLDQSRMILRPAHQLQRQIRLYTVTDIGRTARIETPATIFVLMPENLVDRAFHLAGIPGSKQRVHEDVVSLEHDVGFEFTAPVAVRVLFAEQPVFGPLN